MSRSKAGEIKDIVNAQSTNKAFWVLMKPGSRPQVPDLYRLPSDNTGSSLVQPLSCIYNKLLCESEATH